MKSTIMSLNRLAVLALCFSTFSLAAPTENISLVKRALPVQMGLAKSFGACAATTVTSTGATAITASGGVGDVGTYPGTSIQGFPPGTLSGSLQAGTVAARRGQAACLTAYNDGRGATPSTALPSATLAGLTLRPGIYTFPGSAGTLSGTVTLDARGNSRRQFIFKISTTFTAAAASRVVLINGARACNVYFIVGSSATILADAQMQGNIIAYTSISASAGAASNGTWCALNGGVTLINNAIQAQAGSCPTCGLLTCL